MNPTYFTKQRKELIREFFKLAAMMLQCSDKSVPKDEVFAMVGYLDYVSEMKLILGIVRRQNLIALTEANKRRLED